MSKGWILVTGAARRIGRGIALELAAHGWDIVVHYHRSTDAARQTAEDIQALGQNACLAEIDFLNPHLVEDMIFSLAEEIGMIDAVVNNAALFEPDSGDVDGSRHWAINAEAPRLISKAFQAHLPPKEKGVIVNLLDASFDDVSDERAALFSSYRKSKFFLADLTRNMAKSFAPQVRVNGVAPRFVLPGSRQSGDAFDRISRGQNATVEQVAAVVRRQIETPDATGQIEIV